MKKIAGLLIISALLFLGSCNYFSENSISESTQEQILGDGEFKFELDEYDFGTIMEGEKVSYSFKFRNIGSDNLVISNAKGSCGCTIPNYSAKPVAPGEGGIIDVIFDSTGKKGKQRKTVTLTANTKEVYFNLIIKGEVLSPETEKK